MADLTLRLQKGSPVTFEEMDSNLLALDSDSPFKVSDGHITYDGKVGLGTGADSTYVPTYDLDFAPDGSGNYTLGGTANVTFHVDGGSTFTLQQDVSKTIRIDTFGRVGINLDSPGFSTLNQPLKVGGNIQATDTLIGNRVVGASLSDGFLDIVRGRIVNGDSADFNLLKFSRSGGGLSDNVNLVTSFEIDDVSGNAQRLPTSSAVRFALDSEVAVLNARDDSEHAFNVRTHFNIDSDAAARVDSDHAWAVFNLDSEHAWTNEYIDNVDSDAKARDDSEHAWANNAFTNLTNTFDSALDSEHAWNVAEHTTLQNNIDSEHGYALSQVNLLNARLDSEHAYDVAENNRIDAEIDSDHAWAVGRLDSDHLWASRNFDSEHQYAVDNFDSEHFWAKAYIESGDSALDSQINKEVATLNASLDSEHAWNVAEHAELQQNIDSRADSEHSWNIQEHNTLQSNIDSDHAWANTYISNVDSNSRARDDSDHSWANTNFTAVNARLDSEHAWNVAEHDSARQDMLRRVDSDHQWANTNFAAITNANDSEHAWNVAEHAKLDSNIDSLQRFVLRIDSDNDADRAARFDSEHAWNVAEHTQLRSEIDSDHAWAVSQFDSTWTAIKAIDSANDSDRAKRLDSEHAWNIAEHTQLRAEIDSDHAWAVSNFDSEHTYNITQHTNLQNNIDSDHAWANTYISNVDSDSRARDDSEHAYNVAEHTQLRSEIDSDHAWAVSQFDSTWTAIKAIDSANDSDRAKRLDSEHAWNIAEHAALQASIDSEHSYNVTQHTNLQSNIDSNKGYTDVQIDSEHAWNVAEHDALQVDIDSVYAALQNQVNAAYTTTDFDSDLATKTTTDVAEGTNLYYTVARSDSDFDKNLDSATTDKLSEGTTNLYYTTARADSDAKRAVSAGNGLDYDSSTGVFRTDSQANVVFQDLILTGDLTVNGGQTIINTENLNVSDTRITLNDSSTGVPVNDVGFIFERGNESNATFFFDESEDKFTLGFTNDSGRENGDINVTVGTLVADLEGNVTGQVTDISNHNTDSLAEGNTNLYYRTDRFDSDLGTKTTDDVAEGTTNLYYTQARAKTDFDSGLASKTLDDIAEGVTNLYYTQPRAQADFDSGLATKTTDDLAEGTTNLYYTQSRAQTDFDSGLATKTTDDVAEGTTNLYYTQSRAQTDFDSGLATKSTSDLAEGTNLYYTTSRFDSDLLAKGITGGSLANTDSLPEGTTNLYYTQARAQTDFDSGLATKTTDDVTEGTTNLYYTQARAQTDFDSGLATKTTDNLTEGTTNLYYTQARAQTDFDSGLATKTTDDVTEGTTNLYYTQARAQTDFDSGLATKSTTDVAEGTNLYYTQARFDAALAAKTTTDVAEGTNLYYTQARAQTDFDSGLATKTTDDLSEGSTNLYYTQTRAKTDFDSGLDSAIAAGKLITRNLNNTDSLNEGSVNLYYTQARAQTDFDSGLATKTTDNLTEGTTNLYYTQSRAQTDFDSGLATKSTSDLAEGTNLYYTDARSRAAISATGPLAYNNTTGVVSIPAGNLGTITINGKLYNPLVDSDATLTVQTAIGSTDSVSEGTTNLYYTTARANADFDTRLATKTTTDVAEGTNLYYTNARWDSDLDSAIRAGKFAFALAGINNTDSLPEGSNNLYYTQARAQTDFDSGLATKTTDNLTEGTTNLYYTQSRAQTDFDSGFGTKSTTDLTEGTNLYYTTARADSDAKHAISGGNGIDYDTATGVVRTDSAADVVFNDLTLSGDLTVNGATTTINTQNLAVADTRIAMNKGSTGVPVNDVGFIFERGNEDNATFFFDESEDKFTLGTTTDSSDVSGAITVTTGTLVANLEGNVTGQVTDISNHTTDNLTEGTTNLYYTQARAQTDFDSGLATKTTDDVTEGTTNLYYTQSRAQTDFDSGLATKSTSDLAEGTNLYYTDARSRLALSASAPLSYDNTTGAFTIPAGNLGVLTINGQAFDPLADSDKSISVISAGSLSNTDSLPEGSVNLYYTQARAKTDFDSGLDSAITAGKVITRNLNNTDSLNEGSVNLYYTQSRAQTDFDSGLATKTTTDLAEGTNLYYTDARARLALSGTAPISYNNTTGAISIPAGALGVLTINGQAFDPLADSDKSISVVSAGSLSSTDSLNEGSTNLYYTQARAQTDFDSGLATKTTDDVTEGTTNLYYTQSRAQTDFDSGLATKTTTDLAEGTNLYYTDTRSRAAISATGPLAYNNATGVVSIPAGNLGVLTINGQAFDPLLDSDKSISVVSAGSLSNTDSLPEGSTNLYYTQSRAQTDFDSGLATKSTTDLTEGTNLYYTQARFDAALSAKSTTDVSEGTNLYYTTARADSDAKNAITATAPVAYDASTGTISIPAGNLGVLTINGQVFDPLADSDKSISVISAGSLSNTDSLPEGSVNLYYTQSRAQTDFDSGLATKTTDNLTEGTTNLYYTQSRAQTDFDSGLGTKTTTDLAEGTNLYYTDARSRAAISATAPLSYNNATGVLSIPAGNLGVLTINGQAFDPLADSDKSLTITSSGTSLNNTDSLNEGATNLYYTTARHDSDTNVLVDSDYVALHQRFMHIQTTAPTAPLRSGEMWLDPDDDRVRIWDGDVWFAFPGSTDSAVSSGSFSDERLKDNVSTIGSALDKVDQLRGVEFDWNAGPQSGQHSIGVIAQEVETVFPELIKTQSAFGYSDLRTVDYGKITAVLIEAVKELKQEQRVLNSIIEKLMENN